MTKKETHQRDPLDCTQKRTGKNLGNITKFTQREIWEGNVNRPWSYMGCRKYAQTIINYKFGKAENTVCV